MELNNFNVGDNYEILIGNDLLDTLNILSVDDHAKDYDLIRCYGSTGKLLVLSDGSTYFSPNHSKYGYYNQYGYYKVTVRRDNECFC